MLTCDVPVLWSAGKEINNVRVVVCGCGAAGFTCAKYFVSLGVKKENLLAVDIQVCAYQPVCSSQCSPDTQPSNHIVFNSSFRSFCAVHHDLASTSNYSSNMS